MALYLGFISPLHLQMTMRPELYAQEFAEYTKPDFKPQAVYEPAD